MASVTRKSTVSYVLTLSAEEAEVLVDILGAVSGPHEETRRPLAEGVLDALWEAGVIFGSPRDLTGWILFR